MKKRTLAELILIGLLAAGVATFAGACGGGDDVTTTTAAAGSEATTATATAESGSIVVSGLVDYPMTFTFVDMDYMDWVTATAEDPTTGSASYDGVHLNEIWTFFGVQADAKTVVVTAADGSQAEITLADISSDALLSVNDDDAFNLVMPVMDAEAWVKDAVAMDFK